MRNGMYKLVMASRVEGDCGHQYASVAPEAVAYCDFNSLGVPGPDEVSGYVARWCNARDWAPGDVVELRDYDDDGPVCSAEIVARLNGAEPFGATFRVLPGTWRRGNPSILP